MSAISFIAPYAPQPVGAAQNDGLIAGLQANQPIGAAAKGNGTNLASDHSGQGAGNGTGTGGAQVASLLKRGQTTMAPSDATPKSVVDARTEFPDAFLNQQAELRAETTARQAAREAEHRADRAIAEADIAAKAAKAVVKLPAV
ncbi:hypothetical protein [Roseobacter sp.]|uniref:hypothetical protein n=1 Tax=Roseobacter sp. TaxID=1907202 RepID=UPI003299F144